jgi:hypothetical protein
VLRESERWLGRPLHVTGLPQVKFSAPLLPQEHARMHVRLDGSELRFRIARDGTVVAQGALTLRTESQA